MREIIKKLNDIEGVVVKEANVGIGNANKLTITIKKEEDYIKWSYFLEKLRQQKKPIQVKKAWPDLTFVFLELSIFVQSLNPQNYAASVNGCSKRLL